MNWHAVLTRSEREFARLCAMAGATYEPAINDAEWSARIKDLLARARVTFPTPERMTDAMRAVERSLDRPDPPEATRPAPRPGYYAFGDPGPTRDEARALLARLGVRPKPMEDR